MSEYPSDYPLAPRGSSLDLVFRAMHDHGFEFGDGQDWQCPVHDDTVPSCGIKAGDSKAVIVSCQQCIQRLESSALFKQSFAAALGLDPDLLDADPEGAPRSKLLNEGERQKMGASRRARARVGSREAVYVYTDESGQPVMQVERLIDIATQRKFFRQYTYTPDMGFVLGLREGVERPLYQLPLLRDNIENPGDGEQLWVHFVEGEKSVHEMGRLGYLATCVAGGSNVPDAVLTAAVADLAGVEGVRIIADNDQAGYKFALRVARELQRLDPKPTVEVYRSATNEPGDDAVEHFAEHSYEQLVRISPRRLRKLADGTLSGEDAAPEQVSSPQGVDDPDEETPEDDPSHWPGPDEPFRVARLFARRRYREDDVSTLHYWRGDFYSWDRGLNRYVPVSVDAMRAEVYDVLDAGRYFKAYADKPGQWLAWKPNIGTVTQVIDALKGATYLANEVPEGRWLDGRAGSGYVHFANGHLTVESGHLTPASPLMFNHNALPFPFDPQAPEPVEWLRFLKSVWPDDPGAIDALQEWFGYILSGETYMQKILFMRGPSRSGKGTINTVLQNLVGPSQCCSPTLNGLAGNFGLQPLLGKSLATISDARFGGRSETMKTVVERLLTLSGEDALTVDRKNKEAWFGKLSTRMMILSNEIPRLLEASDALAHRMVILDMKIGHVNDEDRGLAGRLVPEYPGIILWALKGLARLREQSQFTVSKASERVRDELLELGAPVRSFVEEKCSLDASATVPANDLFDAWRMWAAESQAFQMSRQQFGRELRTAFPSVTRIQVRNGKVREWAYRGIKVAG